MLTAASAHTQHAGLIALRAPSRLLAEGEPPTRLVLLKWGDNESSEGNYRVGPKTLAASKLWPQLGYGEVALDFAHNTVKGHPSYQGEPAKIAAMATLSVEEGVGLVFNNLRWTKEGLENRAHYPDLSPTVKAGEDGEVIFCHSGALCRNGAVEGLHAFSAESISPSLRENLITLMADPKKDKAGDGEKAPAHSIKTPTIHKPGQVMVNTDLIKKILKLPADATDDDINAALSAFDQAASGASDNPAATGADSSDPAATGIAALTAAVTASLAGLRTLEAKFESKLAALSAERAADEIAQIVADAVAAGKVIPPEVLPDKDGKGGLPIASLRTLCAALPEVVPLTARTPRYGNSGSAAGPVMTAEDRECMRQCGLDEDTWKKINAA